MRVKTPMGLSLFGFVKICPTNVDSFRLDKTYRDDDDPKSCFKSPKNHVCYSPRYWYRGIRYLVGRFKTLMGLRVNGSLKFLIGKTV